MAKSIDKILARLVKVAPDDRKQFVADLKDDDLKTLHEYLHEHDRLSYSSMLTSTLTHVEQRLGHTS